MRFAIRLTLALALLAPALRLGLVGPGAIWWQTFLAAFVAFGAGHALVALVKQERIALGVAALLLVGGVAFLLYPRTPPRSLLTVAEARAEGNARSVRVRGWVRAGTLVRSAEEIRFVLADGDVGLPVRYRGLPPEQLRDGMEAVARGDLTDGTLVAHELLVRCPDNYDRSKGPAPF